MPTQVNRISDAEETILVFDRKGWLSSPFTQKEKIFTAIYDEPDQVSKLIAKEIVHTIKKKALEGKPCVLGLATGSSPITIYKELVRYHLVEGVSFRHVVTFNLDEYYPMNPDDLQSYVRFMHEHLFDHIDISPENIHIPDGCIAESDVEEYCRAYEAKIKALGGIDLQLLGIGRTGHIGFNEPGSGEQTVTRMINLDHVTRMDAASDFFGVEYVPVKAITMGIRTILDARKIILIALGEGKAPIVQRTIEGQVSDQVPATFLQYHKNAIMVVDAAAAAELQRSKAPWTMGDVTWSDSLIKKAVIWLSETLGKPILKLTDRDYSEYGMSNLILNHGKAYNINLRVFNHLRHTITGWPGGKPGEDDSKRPERAEPAQKRVLIFSPHPDDDVISMGGTFIRLVDQGHEVHVAYQTSGNIAVFDSDVLRYADFYESIRKELLPAIEADSGTLYDQVKSDILNKQKGDIDSDLVRRIKGLIRIGEAKDAGRYVGIPEEQMHFMHLPFYETGRVKKNPVTQADIDITKALIESIQPHQVYIAGDLSDPHGTHRVCLSIILESLNQLKQASFMKDCWVWLYRGAWQEWPIDEIDMAVPLSPDELLKKRKAIFKHQSQKDSALFPGNDPREFWVRAEERNKSTAVKYDQLGLAEYEAIEAFKRYFI